MTGSGLGDPNGDADTTRRPAACCPSRRPGRIPLPRGPAATGTAGALLPDARLRAGCRGRVAGHPAARLAWTGPLRGAWVISQLAVHNRDKRVPGTDRTQALPGSADRAGS